MFMVADLGGISILIYNVSGLSIYTLTLHFYLAYNSAYTGIGLQYSPTYNSAYTVIGLPAYSIALLVVYCGGLTKLQISAQVLVPMHQGRVIGNFNYKARSTVGKCVWLCCFFGH